MKKIIFCLFLLSYVFNTYSVIISVDILKGPQGNYVYIYGDRHAKNQIEVDREQLTAFKGFLELYAAQNEKVHVLIECPTPTVKLSIKRQSILVNLYEECSIKYPTITFEDVEIRQSCIVASMIFDNPSKVPDNGGCYIKRGTLFARSVTFKDIFDEINENGQKIIKHRLYNQNEVIKTYVDYALKVMQERYPKLLNMIQGIDKTLDSSILETSRMLYKEEEEGKRDTSCRLDFRAMLNAIANTIFDIYLLQKMIEQENVGKIIIITGQAHAFQIENMLLHYGYSFIKGYGIPDTEIPVEREILNPVIPIEIPVEREILNPIISLNWPFSLLGRFLSPLKKLADLITVKVRSAELS